MVSLRHKNTPSPSGDTPLGEVNTIWKGKEYGNTTNLDDHLVGYHRRNRSRSRYPDV